MEKTAAYIKLSMLPEVGAATARRLLDKFGSPEAVFEADKSALMSVDKIGEKTADTIMQAMEEIDPSVPMEKMRKIGAEFIHLESPKYPERLKQLDDKPTGFFKLGKAPLDRPSVAIVGSRRCSAYGLSAARRFAMCLARAGITIISGLARGIDTAAHEAALEVKGTTVAVLGCGIDVVYPPENAGLYKRIVEGGGALISEFPMSSHADRQNFPIRNRIISGLSSAVVVIESDLRGGSMITARVAGEQGRDVFAVPGRIDSPYSRGCHALIRDGVRLASSPEDIIDDLAFSGQLELFPSNGDNAGGKTADTSNLSADEIRVLQSFSDGDELSMDDILYKTSLPVFSCMSALTILEIKKFLKKTPSGLWIRRNA